MKKLEEGQGKWLKALSCWQSGINYDAFYSFRASCWLVKLTGLLQKNKKYKGGGWWKTRTQDF